MTSNTNKSERPGLQRRRKASGSAISNCSIPYRRKGPRSAGTDSSPKLEWQHIPSQRQSEPRDVFDHVSYFDPRSSQSTTSTSQPTINQFGNQIGISAPPSSLITNSSLSFFSQAIPQPIPSNDVFTSDSSPDPTAWQPGDVWTPTSSHMGSQCDDMLFPDGQSGVCGSFNSFASSSADTMESVISDNPGFIDTSPTWGSPSSSERMLVDQNMPGVKKQYSTNLHTTFSGGYFEAIPPSPHSFILTAFENSKEFPSDDVFGAESPDWDIVDSFTPIGNTTWPSNDATPTRFNNLDPAGAVPHCDPWSAEDAQHIKNGLEETAGIGAFGPDAGYPYKVLVSREGLFRESRPVLPYFGQGSSFLIKENDPSHREEHCEPDIAPPVCKNEFPQEIPESHEHIFSAITGMGMQDSHRGRKRKLTAEERRRTLEVRKDGACWPCHLSKTKCSPCSSGSPCEQCTRLVGKRRFCLLPCFNDPIESLYKFLVPDCLVGHFTQTNVEAFINQHASRWVKHPISIRLSWGCRRLLTVSVVALDMLGDSSELGYNHQVITDRTGNIERVRKRCAPLGIHLADVDEMQKEYRCHVEDVVKHDLSHYVSIAYDSERSKLAERLLDAVCRWYQRGKDAGDECVLLRQAIEIHVAGLILKRSLILDKTSVEDVEAHLQQQYDDQSAPRAAQRQIKLAFYLEQRLRITRVLREWGKLMRSAAGSGKKWATVFSVFIVLTLIMDQTIAAAYNFTEGRIKFKGRDPRTERMMFEELRRLMETELFEKCKEIFHCRYKTRKGGNERCNPIRDGMTAWRREAVDDNTLHLVVDMQRVVRDFEQDIIVPPQFRVAQASNTKPARLASIFLGEFLNFS